MRWRGCLLNTFSVCFYWLLKAAWAGHVEEDVALPLRTKGRYIVDAQGRRVRLQCVNWSGAEEQDGLVGGLQHQPVTEIARWISKEGRFNCVRIPWSVWMALENPIISNDSVLAANPELKGKSALEIMDAVVTASANSGLMVVLDNHMSDGDWCCSFTDGNGLWYTDNWPAEKWLEAHAIVAARYAPYKAVIGAELRNELRAGNIGGHRVEPTWGTGGINTDWRRAAMDGAAAVQKQAPHWLIFLDCLNYSTNFKDVRNFPLQLPNLVYSAHDYKWSQHDNTPYSALKEDLDNRWGYLFKDANASYQAPVWVSEFGTYHDGREMTSGSWWYFFLRYLLENDLDWAYWRVDGTESRGHGRAFGTEAAFGVFNTTWNGASHDGLLLRDLQKLMVQQRQGEFESVVAFDPLITV